MYLDLEELHPETPRVSSVISVREAVLMSLLAHAMLVIAILLAPKGWFTVARPVAVVPPPSDQIVRFVEIEPRIERPAPPKRAAPDSDLDRRAAAPVVTPHPTTPDPPSVGNTPEKVVGGTTEAPKGAETPSPPAPTTSTPLTRPSPALTTPQSIAPPPGGGLADSLRNLQKYLHDQNYSNPAGQADDKYPDIEFDSKGVDFGPWIRRFIAQLKSNWFVPMAAMSFKGHVAITFNVHKDGSITDIQVVLPSQYESFNTAAVNALRTTNPTLPLPTAYPVDPAFFKVTFYYNEPPIR